MTTHPVIKLSDGNLMPQLGLGVWQASNEQVVGAIEQALETGYRSIDTNNELRARSRGVAKKSYHTKGQAMDFHIEGIALSNIRKAALSMRAGGVGYYPRSNFVHIDTGPARHW